MKIPLEFLKYVYFVYLKYAKSLENGMTGLDSGFNQTSSPRGVRGQEAVLETENHKKPINSGIAFFLHILETGRIQEIAEIFKIRQNTSILRQSRYS